MLPKEAPVKFFSTGAALLDCVLGGGWGAGKVINIVGDKSTGKTLLAIEACANFVRCFADGTVDYCEAEAAFDETYARTVGLPEERVNLVTDIGTLEAVWKRIDEALKESVKAPKLFIVDSLDALSDEAEMGREIGEATMGMAKPKLLSEGFRKLIRSMGGANLTLMIISQIRDKIGSSWGKSVTRSGGHALDFYSSQILWLYEEGKIKRTINALERSIGFNVKMRCEKNKLGWPWRECSVPVIYGYGMDDVAAGIEWLAKAAPLELKNLNADMTPSNYKRHVKKLDPKVVAATVVRVWEEVDKEFRPEKRKYE